MNETKSELITVDDFNNICRVCLQFEEGMMNILGSGINGRIMEIINVKINEDDELPKTLCQNCRLQLLKISEFIEKAKSSECFLRSLLSTDCEGKEFPQKKRKVFRKKRRKSKVKKKLKKDGENMYLIFVNKPDDSKRESRICIKDVNVENPELIQCCKTVMENHLPDHSYLKNEKEELLDWNIFLKNKDEIFAVNLEIFDCSECEEKFEDVKDLNSHLITHGMDEAKVDINYVCPACHFSQSERCEFLNHLKIHKDCVFVKINSSREMCSLKDDEKTVFKAPKLPIDCSLYCLNLNKVSCSVCHSTQSKDTIFEHMKVCFPDEETKFSIKYTCPVCEESFINDESDFVHHLSHHESGNYFFIKANKGVTQVKEVREETVFVLGENLKSKIFEVVETNSCHKCDYVSECFAELLDHCEKIHSERVSFGMIYCPVCTEEFQNDDRMLYYEHLKSHKNEASFILTTKRGALVEPKPEYLNIFTQSFALWDLINSTAVENYVPDCIVSDSSKNCTCETYKEKKKSYICEVCGEEVKGKLGYMKHSLKHTRHSYGGKKPMCGLCGKTFANRTTLGEHLKQHLKEGAEYDTALVCEKCGKTFSNNGSLMKHKKVHSTGKENAALKCDICCRNFVKEAALEKHKSAHLNPKYFECSDCKLPLPSVAGLQKHLEIHKNGSKTYDCKACELSFLTKDSLTAHQTHTGHYLGREPLECNVCHEKFFIGRKFAEHIKTHPKYKMGECSLCGKRLSTIQSLMIHMGRHFETNRILCPHCGKQFFEEKNYHRHLLTHEGIKPFTCNVDSCKKSFYTLFELNRHKKYHNNTRDFKCTYCSKSFHEANHLTVHVRTHTGERPYACPHCNKGFITRTRCKHHIKLIHQGIGYDLIKTSISKKVTVFETIGIEL